MGDEILKQIAGIIQGMIKNKGISARWGGEELALYFHICQLNKVLKMGKQLLMANPS